ncbi:MAG TPA: virulence RhuM family protein [Candidatus Coprenecus stercoravium]|uniref:Virulence RhuM family protein n=1 Tax=Candidatus Coprenecus stercoravium TaxID=2840735 RepID=A0A9D2K9F8_9BACT|nr:virulence RhuM family protein [Candidatus Coprenecus stercoravium]
MEQNEKIVIYQTADGQTRIDVKLENDTVWLSQSQMAELFQTDRTSILKHIKNIYKSSELEENATCAIFAQVRSEGKRTIRRNIPYYNLDVIISVGYRVNSLRGTQFRIWANQVLNARRSYADDSREPHGRDGHDGQGYCQSH